MALRSRTRCSDRDSYVPPHTGVRCRRHPLPCAWHGGEHRDLSAVERDPVTGLFAWADEPLEVSQSGEFRKAAGLWVSGDFFRVLGIQPLLGRLFTAADDHRGCGQGAGVVISYGFWQREFGGNPAVVGQETTIGNYRTAIIGVTPQTGLKPYDPLSLTIAGLSLAAVAAAASFIPAWRASSVDPVTALRQD